MDELKKFLDEKIERLKSMSADDPDGRQNIMSTLAQLIQARESIKQTELLQRLAYPPLKVVNVEVPKGD